MTPTLVRYLCWKRGGGGGAAAILKRTYKCPTGPYMFTVTRLRIVQHAGRKFNMQSMRRRSYGHSLRSRKLRSVQELLSQERGNGDELLVSSKGRVRRKLADENLLQILPIEQMHPCGDEERRFVGCIDVVSFRNKVP